MSATFLTLEQRLRFERNERKLMASDDCRCVACLDNLPDDGYPVQLGRLCMVVCAICGNKRCPHTEDHRYACTGSNAPNQVPSVVVDNAFIDEPESEYALPPTWSEVLGLLAGGGLDDVE